MCRDAEAGRNIGPLRNLLCLIWAVAIDCCPGILHWCICREIRKTCWESKKVCARRPPIWRDNVSFLSTEVDVLWPQSQTEGRTFLPYPFHLWVRPVRTNAIGSKRKEVIPSFPSSNAESNNAKCVYIVVHEAFSSQFPFGSSSN